MQPEGYELQHPVARHGGHHDGRREAKVGKGRHGDVPRPALLARLGHQGCPGRQEGQHAHSKAGNCLTH